MFGASELGGCGRPDYRLPTVQAWPKRFDKKLAALPPYSRSSFQGLTGGGKNAQKLSHSGRILVAICRRHTAGMCIDGPSFLSKVTGPAAIDTRRLDVLEAGLVGVGRCYIRHTSRPF